MRVIHLDDVPLVGRPNIRGGTLLSRRLLCGESGTPGNFSLQLSSTPTYYSPRHRHNFDQIRYQLSGDFDFSTDGVMKPGMVAYFPEGTYYGPQRCENGSETLVLQFGGASRSGYLSAEEHERAAAELASRGTFSNGVYTPLKPDGGKINKDAYEAVWEQVNRRLLVYPGERYLRPVFMDPENFDWQPVAGQPGACENISANSPSCARAFRSASFCPARRCACPIIRSISSPRVQVTPATNLSRATRPFTSAKTSREP